MPAYRFCRPDDIPRLVEAIEKCWRPHFPDEPAMTLERFRWEMKALDLWPSSCMMATEGGEPISLVVGAKRATETEVLRVATRPGYERRGHASHVLDSLRRKLAVLGPPRLVACVPRHLAPAVALFASLGWRREASFVDLVLPAATGGESPRRRLPADDPAVRALLAEGAVVAAEVDRWAVSATAL